VLKCVPAMCLVAQFASASTSGALWCSESVPGTLSRAITPTQDIRRVLEIMVFGSTVRLSCLILRALLSGGGLKTSAGHVPHPAVPALPLNIFGRTTVLATTYCEHNSRTISHSTGIRPW
jgi:hypothetical protein